ncbi:hypothetical protein LOC68_06020 [Blastopirellula sp. JC732]|uniref:Uncharacterized protein n=1 Tax=Blastopirellula sediminis TaxID=2894196 RepID=A0A9X1SIC3_9BACT|nr:hypothetical protein [Blastopirellula sediminis]MCC9609279.1 hypothetical protein [Blastopirellula sediminis]MCC9627944.1 hypothetical protein [Blastopirellula sediminis]
MWIFDTISTCTSSYYRTGDYGSIEVNTTYVPQRNIAVVMFKSIVSLAMLGGVGYWMFTWRILPQDIPSKLAIIVGVELMYVALAFFIVPRPNYDNMGYLGGWINNPWKYSDDYNRGLRDWNVILGPGRFISTTLLDCAAMLGWMTADPTEEERFAKEMGMDLTEDFPATSLSSATRIDLDLMAQEPPAASMTKCKVNRGDFD